MTAQVREKLLYEGEEVGMNTEPLNRYLFLKNENNLINTSTNCWRGYIGKWEIINDKLYLIDFKAFIKDYEEVGLEYLFPGQKKVFAEWFTGILKIPRGEMIEYIHMGYESIYEKQLNIVILKGVVVLKREHDNRDKSLD